MFHIEEGNQPATVTLTLEQDSDIWTLENEKVQIKIDTQNTYVTEFRTKDGENVLHSNGAYFDFNEANGFFGSIGTKGNPTIEPPRLCSQTDDYIDVGIRARMFDPETDWRSPLAFDWHIVLQKGDTGFYTYIITKHIPISGEMTIGQLRFILWTTSRFKDYALTPERTGHLLEHEWKYTLTRQWEPYSTHGLIDPDSKEGIWAIYGSKFWSRGPDQRELSLHLDAQSGIAVLLTMLEAGHYGRFPTSRPSGIHITEGWEKIYGPVFYMLTSGGNHGEMFESAQKRADCDRKHFPPEWLSDKIGTMTKVTGNIAPNNISHPVRIVLRNDRYSFWTTCPSGKKFEIDKVLIGTYTLTARQGPYAFYENEEIKVDKNFDIVVLAIIRI